MGEKSTLEFSKPKDDKEMYKIIGHFIPTFNDYNVKATSNNIVWGTVSGSDVYKAEKTARLTATPTEHGEFVAWRWKCDVWNDNCAKWEKKQETETNSVLELYLSPDKFLTKDIVVEGIFKEKMDTLLPEITIEVPPPHLPQLTTPQADSTLWFSFPCELREPVKLFDLKEYQAAGYQPKIELDGTPLAVSGDGYVQLPDVPHVYTGRLILSKALWINIEVNVTCCCCKVNGADPIKVLGIFYSCIKRGSFPSVKDLIYAPLNNTTEKHLAAVKGMCGHLYPIFSPSLVQHIVHLRLNEKMTEGIALTRYLTQEGIVTFMWIDMALDAGVWKVTLRGYNTGSAANMAAKYPVVLVGSNFEADCAAYFANYRMDLHVTGALPLEFVKPACELIIIPKPK